LKDCGGIDKGKGHGQTETFGNIGSLTKSLVGRHFTEYLKKSVNPLCIDGFYISVFPQN